MKKEPIKDYLRRRLGELKGEHNRIARETGVAQATVSRIYLGQASPTLDTVQPILDWLDKHDRIAVRQARARRRIDVAGADGAAAAGLSH